jgi:hypothetical protein
MLEFRPVNSAFFTVSSNLSAGTVLLNEAGGLFLNGASPTLTNVIVAKANPTSGSISATAGITANDSLALGTNGMLKIINSNLIGNSGAIFRLGNNVSIPSGVAMDVNIPNDGDAGPGGYRATLGTLGTTSTNAWNGPIIVHGGASGGAVTILIARPENTSRLVLNGNLTLADGDATLLMRGNGHTVVNGHINWGTNVLNTTADGTVDITINSTGNTWRLLSMGTSTLHLGANNALPVNSPVELIAAGALLDMNGFNQQLGGLYGSAGGVRNNSTNTDSTLIVSSALGTNWLLAGAITHLPGAKSLNLDVAGDTLTLSAAGNNYTGSTTIRSGATLGLLTSGNITASSVINVQAGGNFDVSGKTTGEFTLSSPTTLKGNGTVFGSIAVPAGTVAPGASVGTLTVTNNATLSAAGVAYMEVNNATATNDRLNVGGTLTYGGTLVVTNTSAMPYTNNQVIKLFDSATAAYAGSFANIVFPGVGSYSAANLTVDGSITVVSVVSTSPVTLTNAVTGGGSQLEITWPTDHTGWRLETNAVSVTAVGSWFTSPGSSATNHVYLPIQLSKPNVFFRLVYP